MSSRDRIRRSQIIRQAEGYLELGMPEHALGALARLKRPGTFRSHVLYLKGEALRSLARHDEAVEQLEEASELAPSNVHIRLALAWCYKRTNRLELAIATLEEALETNDDEALLYYNLACYHSLAGDKAQALSHLSTAFELDGRFRDRVETEEDFDPLRGDPDFQALTSIIV